MAGCVLSTRLCRDSYLEVLSIHFMVIRTCLYQHISCIYYRNRIYYHASTQLCPAPLSVNGKPTPIHGPEYCSQNREVLNDLVSAPQPHGFSPNCVFSAQCSLYVLRGSCLKVSLISQSFLSPEIKLKVKVDTRLHSRIKLGTYLLVLLFSTQFSSSSQDIQHP